MIETLNSTINGKQLYYAFVAGSHQILHYQQEINLINVFPVSDKDTGTNLASTVRSVIEQIKPDKSYKKTLNGIADAALVGARGNSGVIFAQFLYGLNTETKNSKTITFSDFIDSVRNSVPYMYQAILNPVEGTILTIIKDWSDYLCSQKETIIDLKEVLINSFVVLEKSLAETTSKLKELSKHGVVDAGAKGFVVFILGVVEFLKNGNIRSLNLSNQDPISLIHSENSLGEEITFRFCTEAILKNLTLKKEELQNTLSKSGDSVVIAGSEDVCRIHVHTNHPAELFHQLKDFGTITFQKVDDMVRQQEIISNRKWKIALLTDSTCDLSQELIDFYQINVVPINLNFGDNHYLDKVTIQP
ncbi:MAG: DAK2 domain-containing protein, partial [Bacteroidales bacterium]|nr:DAK2 domain-containing protein [Bacteroidales bacterium]